MKLPSLLPHISAAILLATAVHSDCCRKDWGRIVTNEAFAAIELIPVPTLDHHETAIQGHPVFAIPDAAHHLAYPIVFHFRGAIVEIQETWPTAGHLSAEEKAFFLWPAAERAALRVMARCVRGTYGQYGGWAEFDVTPPGIPGRRFEVRVKGVSRVDQVLQNYHWKGIYVWP